MKIKLLKQALDLFHRGVFVIDNTNYDGTINADLQDEAISWLENVEDLIYKIEQQDPCE